MSLLTTPVPIVAGQTLKLAPPEGQAGQFAGMCVVNLSNFLLIASVGPTTTYVIPGTITPVPLSGNGQAVSVTAAYAPASGGSGSVGAQWYYNGENVPPVAVPIGEQVVVASSTVTGPVTVQTAAGTPISNLPVAPESIISAELGGPGATLIAGVAGKSIYLHHVAYTIQSPDTSLTSPGVIQGSNAGAVICYVNPSVPGQVIPLGGYALALGESLDWLTNSFPAGLSAYTTITYTIA